jgi:hypothetical protein
VSHRIEIRTRKIPATETKGAEISVRCEGWKKILPYDPGADDPHETAAQALAKEIGAINLLRIKVTATGAVYYGTVR